MATEAVTDINPVHHGCPDGFSLVVKRARQKEKYLPSGRRALRLALLRFEHQQRFAPVCGRFGQINRLTELFDGDRLPLGHP